MPSKQIIYPLFLAHSGCPFRCVYCDQTQLTATKPERTATEARVEQLRDLARSARTQGRPGEIAFYGGTFTLLPRAALLPLLSAARREIETGAFTGIRFSTRPDAVSEEVLGAFGPFPVSTIELGAQSLSDPVLEATRRGYRADQVHEAVGRLKAHGYQIGIQLMVGLPGETADDFRKTITAAAALKPDFVRLYPTLVLKGTVLERWYAGGRYTPLSLDRALDWSSDAYEVFRQADIRIARMGLHADPQLTRPGVVVAGPCHPAFGYLVKVTWWRRRLAAALGDRCGVEREIVVRVPGRQLSEVLGPNRDNIERLRRQLRLDRLEILADRDLGADQWQLEWKGANDTVRGSEETAQDHGAGDPGRN